MTSLGRSRPIDNALRSTGPKPEMENTVSRDYLTGSALASVNPKQMGGVPCVRGLRIGMIADRMTDEESLAAYPDLEGEDIHEALRYAADAVRERELPLAIP
jgi:uncharacterized protein (DUF433 family)